MQGYVNNTKKETRVSLKQQNLNVAQDSIVQLNAKNLKRLRVMKAYTLEILSELSGLSTSYISRLEAAARRMNAQTLNRLARALECSPVSFFETKTISLDKQSGGYKKDIPVYRVIPAGAQVSNNPYSIIFLTEPVDHAFNVPPFLANENIFAIYAINNLWAPKFKEGDLLYFDKKEVKVGDFVSLVDNDNCLFLGELVDNKGDVVINVSVDGDKKKMIFAINKIKQIAKLLTVVFFNEA